MKEESLLLLSDLQKLINQVVLIDYTIIILGGGEVIHIKETEIIPFLKTAQTGYTKMISEGDLEMEVELAEKVEEALTQAMDIIYDYQSMADEHKRMVEKYETEAPVIKRGMDFYCCPACGKRTSRNHTHCHWCGKKLGWSRRSRK